MSHSPYRWILTLLRYGLCVVAVWYLVTHVPWYDYVRLNDANKTRVRLLEDHGQELVILRENGTRETISRDQVNRLANGAVEDIEYGIAGVVRRIHVGLALLSILIFFPVPVLQSLRLVWMLAIQDVRLSFWNSVKLTYAGNFFNFALPGTTGGDLIKAYYITRFTHHKTEAVTSVFLDRVIGLLGLVLLAGVMILVSWDQRRFGTLAVVLAVICGVLVLGGVIVFSRRLRTALRLADLVAKLPMSDQLLRVGRATVAMRRHKTLVVASFLNTLVLQFIVIVSTYVMALALDMEGGFARYLVYIPIGFLIAAVPISPPQAFGVLEWAYIQFFVQSGLDNSVSQAVAFALAVRVIQLAWALPGVLVPLFGAHLPSQAEREAMSRPDDVLLDEDSAGPAAAMSPASGK